MNRNKTLLLSVVAVALSMITVALFEMTPTEYVYVQSDITKANPNLRMASAEYDMLEDITLAKNTIVLTLLGTILSVGDPIPWTDDADNKLGYVPITIQVDGIGKNASTELKIDTGDTFTFYLGGSYEGGLYFVDGFEAQFEIDEQSLIHIGNAVNGPELEGGFYFVELGKYGKYKVVEDKAYNEKYIYGKSLDKVFDEAK